MQCGLAQAFVCVSRVCALAFRALGWAAKSSSVSPLRPWSRWPLAKVTSDSPARPW